MKKIRVLSTLAIVGSLGIGLTACDNAVKDQNDVITTTTQATTTSAPAATTTSAPVATTTSAPVATTTSSEVIQTTTSTVVEEHVTVSFEVNGGNDISPLQITKNTALGDVTPTRDGFVFMGWYTDIAKTTIFDATSLLNEDITLYAKWGENVSYDLNCSELETKTYEATSFGQFGVLNGTQVRSRSRSYTSDGENLTFTKSIKLSNGTGFVVNAPAAGKLTMYIQNGSSGASTQKLNVTLPNGSSDEIEFAGTSSSSPIVKLELDVTEGQYVFACGGTTDIYLAKMTCLVEESEETGFEIEAEGNTVILEGSTFDTSNIRINSVFENGKKLSVQSSDFTVDTSKIDYATPGIYNAYVNYKDYEAQAIEVVVCEAQSLELYNHTISTYKNTNQNTAYATNTLKYIYKSGEELDSSNLITKVLALNPKTNKQVAFNTSFNASVDDLENLGMHTVSVIASINNKEISATYNVYVVGSTISDEITQISVNVDSKLAANLNGSEVDGVVTFSTITNALQYLTNLNLANDVKKVINVMAGTYNEKLDIRLANLTIIGEDVEDAKECSTKITASYVNGDDDATGTMTYGTDGSATVTIGASAVGFKAQNIWFDNGINTLELYTATKNRTSGTQGVALLVAADMAIFDNCKLTGYQDTLEAQCGRQYYNNCYISGATDFIFGYNATAFFNGCEIHVIDNGIAANGGYICASKGFNQGVSKDTVTYGYIFYQCDFTAESSVPAGTTSLARPWGNGSAVATIECNLGSHISKIGYTDKSQGERYVNMSGNNPTDSTCQFKEYNNTGAGAISEAVSGMTFLTEEEYLKFIDLTVVFGKTNGLHTYSVDWNPISGEIEQDTKVYYNFDRGQSATGTSYTYELSLGATSTDEKTATLGDITLDATKGKIVARSSDTQINAGGVIRFSVQAGTAVTFNTYSNYHEYTVNGIATSLDTFTLYYSEDTIVEFKATATVYLLSIVIDDNATAPEKATVTSISVSGQTLEFTEEDEFSIGNMVVKANYSDGSIVTLDEAEYTVDSSNYEKAAGTYSITVSVGEVSTTYSVTVVAGEIDNAISTPTMITFGTTGNYKDITRLNISEANVRDNGGDNCQIYGTLSFDVKSGATISISSYSGYTSYTVSYTENGQNVTTQTQTGTSYEFSVAEDTTITFSCGSNNYFYSIAITFDE